jgi:hypothetical protein
MEIQLDNYSTTGLGNQLGDQLSIVINLIEKWQLPDQNGTEFRSLLTLGVLPTSWVVDSQAPCLALLSSPTYTTGNEMSKHMSEK